MEHVSSASAPYPRHLPSTDTNRTCLRHLIKCRGWRAFIFTFRRKKNRANNQESKRSWKIQLSSPDWLVLGFSCGWLSLSAVFLSKSLLNLCSVGRQRACVDGAAWSRHSCVPSVFLETLWLSLGRTSTLDNNSLIRASEKGALKTFGFVATEAISEDLCISRGLEAGVMEVLRGGREQHMTFCSGSLLASSFTSQTHPMLPTTNDC